MPHSPPTVGDADIARVAALIGERSRARVLMALAGGRKLSAGRLAAEAGVARSTISGHLAQLLEGQLLHAERSGRARYFSLADESVARALEALAEIAPPELVRTLRQSTRADALRRARTCYEHLAGRLGVALMKALLERELLIADHGRPGTVEPTSEREITYRLTERGREGLGDFGVDIGTVLRKRTPIRHCIDWSEREHHLAGALGTALTNRLFELGWIERGKHPRAVSVTDAGRAGLQMTFGVGRDWERASL